MEDTTVGADGLAGREVSGVLSSYRRWKHNVEKIYSKAKCYVLPHLQNGNNKEKTTTFCLLELHYKSKSLDPTALLLHNIFHYVSCN